MRRNTTDYVKKLAKELRKSMTPAEVILWKRLRNRNLKGYKFHRQYPIGRYIADFYCDEIKLAIEVDGEIHIESERKEYDLIRQSEIESRRIRVIRFNNDEVLNNTENVIQSICSLL